MEVAVAELEPLFVYPNQLILVCFCYIDPSGVVEVDFDLKIAKIWLQKFRQIFKSFEFLPVNTIGLKSCGGSFVEAAIEAYEAIFPLT